MTTIEKAKWLLSLKSIAPTEDEAKRIISEALDTGDACARVVVALAEALPKLDHRCPKAPRPGMGHNFGIIVAKGRLCEWCRSPMVTDEKREAVLDTLAKMLESP